jgi:Undecaprenyl-phosphate galactose phosphotransferase WbaP
VPPSDGVLFQAQDVFPDPDVSGDGAQPLEGARPLVFDESIQIPTSRGKTLLSFLLGDLTGLLFLSGGMFLGLHAFLSIPEGGLHAFVLGLLPIFLLPFLLIGPFRRRFSHPALEIPRVAGMTGIIGGIVGLTILLTTGLVGPALIAVIWGGLGMILLPLTRVCTRVFCSRASWWGTPAVLITAGRSGEGILRTLRRWPEMGLRPVAVLSDTEPESPRDQCLYGPCAQASYLARTFSIPYALVALPSGSHTDRAKLVLRYAKFFDHVVVLPDEPERTAFWTTGQSGDGLFGYSVRDAAARPGLQFLKRFVDVIASGVLILATAPILAAIAIAIRRDSDGGVLYRQERMGLDGRIFRVLKFRTMYEDADQRLSDILESDPARNEEYGRYHKLKDDPRITAVGRVLRRYSLDELPQLFNVLWGDMSLVGPRAYMPSELPQMDRLARVVLQVPPGVTGLWQVSGRNDVSFRERVALDVHYVHNWSLALDFYLLARTVPTVLSGDGAS